MSIKITIINASPRKNGATAKILDAFAKQLKAYKDAEISLFHLSDLNYHFCKGCCACYQSGRCIMQDDAEKLSQTIAESDGLIIGTPNYASNISGQLKTFIDRGHFVIEQLLKDKHTLGVVTYENAEGRAVYKVLKKLFSFSGARTVAQMIVKVPFNSDPLAAAQINTKIKKKANRLCQSISQKRRHPLANSIIHFFVFHFGIKPLVIKKGAAYSGVREHWKVRGIM